MGFIPNPAPDSRDQRGPIPVLPGAPQFLPSQESQSHWICRIRGSFCGLFSQRNEDFIAVDLRIDRERLRWENRGGEKGGKSGMSRGMFPARLLLSPSLSRDFFWLGRAKSEMEFKCKARDDPKETKITGCSG